MSLGLGNLKYIVRMVTRMVFTKMQSHLGYTREGIVISFQIKDSGELLHTHLHGTHLIQN